MLLLGIARVCATGLTRHSWPNDFSGHSEGEDKDSGLDARRRGDGIRERFQGDRTDRSVDILLHVALEGENELRRMLFSCLENTVDYRLETLGQRVRCLSLRRLFMGI